MPPTLRLRCLIFAHLACLPLFSAHASPEVPTPRMSYSIDLSSDPRTWVVASHSGNTNSVLVEMLPEGTDPRSWSELVTNMVAFGSEVGSYVAAWRARLAAQGARIVFDREANDGSRVVRYASSDECGIWKFTQGPDGVYGVSYQFRPGNRMDILPDAWQRAVSSATLVKPDSTSQPAPSPSARPETPAR